MVLVDSGCDDYFGLPETKIGYDEKMLMLVSEEKGPKPLVINAAGHRWKGLAAGADHEDATFVLPFKSHLTPRANNEDDTLLNTYQRASSGSHEIILHNKTFKMKK